MLSLLRWNTNILLMEDSFKPALYLQLCNTCTWPLTPRVTASSTPSGTWCSTTASRSMPAPSWSCGRSWWPAWSTTQCFRTGCSFSGDPWRPTSEGAPVLPSVNLSAPAPALAPASAPAPAPATDLHFYFQVPDRTQAGGDLLGQLWRPLLHGHLLPQSEYLPGEQGVNWTTRDTVQVRGPGGGSSRLLHRLLSGQCTCTCNFTCTYTYTCTCTCTCSVLVPALAPCLYLYLHLQLFFRTQLIWWAQ